MRRYIFYEIKNLKKKKENPISRINFFYVQTEHLNGTAKDGTKAKF